MPQVETVSEKGQNLFQKVSQCLIALGSNSEFRGVSPTKTLAKSVDLLSAAGCVIRAKSRNFETPAFPPGAGPAFVNAAIHVTWAGTAHTLMKVLHDVEAEFGRQREHRWSARTLDLDLLLMDDEVHPDPQTVITWMDLDLDAQKTQTPDQLLVPHPRMHDRSFVLVPLMDIAPDWVHPITKLSVRMMHDALPQSDRDAVIPLVNREDCA